MANGIFEKSTTITELIASGYNNNYNITSLSSFVQIGDSLLNIGGYIFDNYISFIHAIKMKATLDKEYKIRYKYNPKKLSLDLYETEELWYLLLKINNITSEINFKPDKYVYIINPDYLNVLNEILIANSDKIKENHTEFKIK